MMTTLRLTAMLLLALAMAGPANAQGGRRGRSSSLVPRYTPKSPTVSPYIGLLSRNGTAAENYFGLVRPLQRQQSVNERTTQQTAYQEQELQGLQLQQKQAFEQPTVKPTGTAGWFNEFGQRPPYRQQDHYYGQWPAGGRTGARGR